MNIYRKRIIDLMEYKNGILSFDDVIYFTEEDRKSIMKWKSSVCEAFIDNALRYDKAFHWNWDINLCPFCFKNDFNELHEEACEKCAYGDNHGFCIERKSTYTKITKHHNYPSLWDIFTGEQRTMIKEILAGKLDIKPSKEK